MTAFAAASIGIFGDLGGVFGFGLFCSSGVRWSKLLIPLLLAGTIAIYNDSFITSRKNDVKAICNFFSNL